MSGGERVVVYLGLGLALAVTAAAVVGIWLLGADRLFVLALILVGGLALAGVLAAAALLVRQYRRSDANPVVEHHYHHDGTRTVERVIDGRPAALPQLPQLPAPGYGMFPELLRAAYQAGRSSGGGEAVDAVVRDVGWDGEMRS